MDATTILADARAALDEQGRRFAALIGSLPISATPIVGSEWTIRQAAVHWGMGAGLYAELATGTPSPIESLPDKAPVAACVLRRRPGNRPGQTRRAHRRWPPAVPGRHGGAPW